LRLARQLGPHSNQGIEQLGTRAFGRRRAEDGLGMLEAGMTTEWHVAKAEHCKEADACFYTAPTKYSEHRRIVGMAG